MLLSANGSVNVTAVTAEIDWRSTSLFLLEEQAADSECNLTYVVLIKSSCGTSKCHTGFNGSSNGRLGFTHPLHHALQLFSSSLWRHLGGFYYSIIGMINPERQDDLTTLFYTRPDCSKNELLTQYRLQRSVSKHDPVQGEGSGHRLLLNKLHEGEASRLGLVAGHSDKLHISDLFEKLQQLLCSGGLWKERDPM